MGGPGCLTPQGLAEPMGMTARECPCPKSRAEFPPVRQVLPASASLWADSEAQGGRARGLPVGPVFPKHSLCLWCSV